MRVWALALLLLPASAAAGEVIVDASHKMQRIGKKLDVLREEGSRRWRIEEVAALPLSSRFAASEQEVPSFGFLRSAVWVRFTLRSALTGRRDLFLELPHPQLDHVEIYARRAGKWFDRVKTGDLYPLSSRPMTHHNFVFPLTLGPGEAVEVFVRLSSDSAVQADLRLWQAEAFVEADTRALVAHGLFYGLLLVLGAYNLFLFISVRQRSYLLYVLTVGSVVLLHTFLDGFAAFFWPLPSLSNQALSVAIYATSLCSLLFTERFLNLKKHAPRWQRGMNIGIFVLVGAGVLSLFLPRPGMLLAAVASMGSATVVALVSLLRTLQGFRPARYLLAAWGMLMLCVLLFLLSRTGLLPYVQLFEISPQIGFALNALLLSIAIADRIDLLQDETEKTQLELQEAYKQLAEQDQRKSRLFANISHEVRTPLTLILAPLEYLLRRKGQLPKVVRDAFTSARGQLHRLLQLVNQLLDFSRLESGRSAVSFEQRELGALVAKTTTSFETFARSKGLSMELRRPESSLPVWVDVEKLEKVLCNLLSNAIKFTAEGGRIAVSAGKNDEVAEAWVRVVDNGRGIPADQLPKIFDRFRATAEKGVRARRATEGTGIGLALSKEMIELCGGRLTLDSEEELGTTATVTVPLGRGHVDALGVLADVVETKVTVEVAAVTPAAETRDEASLEGQSLLVVEERADVRALVAEVCGGDFEVIEARNVAEAMSKLDEGAPSLIVIGTPSDSGALIERVRSAPAMATTPVILLGSDVDMEERIARLEQGADDFLLKPFDPRELRVRARNLVKHHKQRRRLGELNAKLQGEVMEQAAMVERAMLLGRYLPIETVRGVMEGGEAVEIAQRRCRLTVFRLELRGFDTFVSQLEPEETAAILNGYISEMMNLAFSHGATVDRFCRDVFTGFYGAPTSKGEEADALRCTRLALDIQQRALDLCERWRDLVEATPPVPTIVLTSGYSTVGNFGCSTRMEYTAVGGPADEAALLLSAVDSGELCCSQTTWMLLDGKLPGQQRREVLVGKRLRPVMLHALACGDALAKTLPPVSILP